MKVSQIKVSPSTCIMMPNCGVWMYLNGENAKRNFIAWFGDVEVVKYKRTAYKCVEEIDHANSLPQSTSPQSY